MSLDFMNLSGSSLDISHITSNNGFALPSLIFWERIWYGTSQITYLMRGINDMVIKVLDTPHQERFQGIEPAAFYKILKEWEEIWIPFPKIYGVLRGKIAWRELIAFLQSRLDIYLEDGFPVDIDLSRVWLWDREKVLRGMFQLKDKTLVFWDWIPYISPKLKPSSYV